MNILFLCVANSSRSQMAEGLAKSMLGTSVRVESAGSKPTQVNYLAIQVMNEVEIDISSHRSKSVDELDPAFIQELNYIVTLCAEEVCPHVLSKATRLHWPLPDPAGQNGSVEHQLNQFRMARDEIASQLNAFAVASGLGAVQQ